MAAWGSLHSLLDYECLLFHSEWLGSDLRIRHYESLRNKWRMPNDDSLPNESESESYITTDGQPTSLSWIKAPIWGLQPDFYYCQTVAGLLISLYLTVPLLFCFYSLPRKRVLASRCLAMDYSGFQASCHNTKLII
jgi:hypothetical protein